MKMISFAMPKEYLQNINYDNSQTSNYDNFFFSEKMIIVTQNETEFGLMSGLEPSRLISVEICEKLKL